MSQIVRTLELSVAVITYRRPTLEWVQKLSITEVKKSTQKVPNITSQRTFQSLMLVKDSAA